MNSEIQLNYGTLIAIIHHYTVYRVGCCCKSSSTQMWLENHQNGAC
jgi:hypothetical protein